MSDKKKKKFKMKQKQKQSQQVIVNIGGRVSSSRREQPPQNNKLNTPMQPPPIVQYVYRDNLALNALNEKARENALTQTLLKTAQQLSQTQQQNQAPKLATPSPALYQQQQPIIQTPALSKSRQPNTPAPISFSSIANDLLKSNKLFNQVKFPDENTNRQKNSDFEKLLQPAKPIDDETEMEDNVPVREPFRNQSKPLPFRATKGGVPYKRNKDYGFYMEYHIGKIPENERTREQQKAYLEYIGSKKPSANDEEPVTPPLLPTTPTSSASVQPVDFEPTNDDDEEEFFLSPLKKNPT
jgi:hypothetical protein